MGKRGRRHWKWPHSLGILFHQKLLDPSVLSSLGRRFLGMKLTPNFTKLIIDSLNRILSGLDRLDGARDLKDDVDIVVLPDGPFRHGLRFHFEPWHGRHWVPVRVLDSGRRHGHPRAPYDALPALILRKEWGYKERLRNILGYSTEKIKRGDPCQRRIVKDDPN